jgi:hypothetical protein
MTDKQKFWLRMGLTILFAIVIPFSAIAWKFELFGWREGSYSLTGWGILVVLFLTTFIMGTIRKYTKELPYSFLKQVIDTINYTVIPLSFGTLLFWMVQNTQDAVYFVLRVALFSVPIGGLINPLPAWAQKQKDQHQINILKEGNK